MGPPLRLTARKPVSVHLLELDPGRSVPSQPVHSPRLPSAIFSSFHFLEHPPHIFQGENRHGRQATGHVGWDWNPDEVRAPHQATAEAGVRIQGGPRLRRKPTRWDWPRRVLLQHMKAHTIMSRRN